MTALHVHYTLLLLIVPNDNGSKSDNVQCSVFGVEKGGVDVTRFAGRLMFVLNAQYSVTNARDIDRCT